MRISPPTSSYKRGLGKAGWRSKEKWQGAARSQHQGCRRRDPAAAKHLPTRCAGARLFHVTLVSSTVRILNARRADSALHSRAAATFSQSQTLKTPALVKILTGKLYAMHRPQRHLHTVAKCKMRNRNKKEARDQSINSSPA